MNGRRGGLWLVGIGLLAAHAASAPGVPAQSRSRNAPVPPPPSATVSGRVVTGDPPERVTNARIVVNADGLAAPIVLMSDDKGGFRTQIAGTRISLAVTKTGFGPVRLPVVSGDDTIVHLPRSAVIAGRILDELGEPAISQRVSAERIEGTAATAISAAVTDDRGEYRLAGLAAGRYRVVMPVPSANFREERRLFYPATAEPSEAEPLELVTGQERGGVDLVLPPGISALMLGAGINFVAASNAQAGTVPGQDGASVRGRVFDAARQPLANAVVTLNGPQFFKRVLSGPDGEFAFNELPPVRVDLRAVKAGYQPLASAVDTRGYATVELKAGDNRSDIELRMVPWSTATGRVVDEYGDPVQGARVQLMQVRYERGRQRLVGASGAEAHSTNDLGVFRLWNLPPGRYLASAIVGEVLTAELPGYGRSFYPGTTDPSGAQFITVPPSGDTTGVDITLVRQQTFRVAGRLLDAAGRPSGAGSLMLWPSVHSPSGLGIPAGARIERNGTFEFVNVTPGPYVVQASLANRNRTAEGEFGAIAINVTNQDLTDVVLQRTSGSVAAGRLITSGASLPQEALARLEITTAVADVDLSPANNLAVAQPDQAQQFVLRGLNGPRRLIVQRLPAGWSLERITMSGIDVTDRIIDFGRPDAPPGEIEIELTNRVSLMQGMVTDRSGRGLPRAGLIVFPADQERWYAGSRFLRRSTTADNGTYRVEGLPSGNYYVAAVAQPLRGDTAWTDPSYLESLVPQTVSTVLFLDQTTTLNVRVE